MLPPDWGLHQVRNHHQARGHHQARHHHQARGHYQARYHQGTRYQLTTRGEHPWLPLCAWSAIGRVSIGHVTM